MYYFLIGMSLTVRAIFGDNSIKRAMTYGKCPFNQRIHLARGEVFMEGVLCGVVVIAIIIAFFYMWGEI
jgi:hypothetical protein